jgi:hypothetical protein
MAVKECLNKVDFGEVMIFTDRPSEFASLTGSFIIRVPDWPSKMGYSLFRYREVAPYIATSHALFIEWDSWVWDTAMWDDEFLDYDYVGPPWKYDEPNKNVGGGGFCLVSARLKRYLHDHPSQYPLPIISDDWLLCCEYRPRLEAEGFVWAPEDLAYRFAFEYYRPSPTSRHFGFHGIFNFNEVLPPDRLEERTKLILASKHATTRGGSDGDGGPDIAWQRFEMKNAKLLENLGYEASVR